jgi:LacI family transcriptional regulator
MKRPTQNQIAQRAGVSQTAVSMILANRPDVAFSAECRDRVMAACRELGYKLPRRRTMTLGLLVPDSGLAHEYLASTYYARFYRGLVRAADEHGYSVLLHEWSDHKELPRIMREGRVDGLVVAASCKAHDLRRMQKAVPMVLLDWHADGMDETSVMPDNAGDMAKAVRHLHELGHERIAFFGLGPPEKEGQHQQERFRGYQAIVAEIGLASGPPLTHFTRPQASDYSDAETLVGEAVDYFLRLSRPPTAVLSYSDVHILRFMRSAQEKGWLVPRQLSLIGFDNTDACEYSQPPLSSIDQSQEEMAASAAMELVARIENADHPVRFLRHGVRLHERGSVAPPPRTKRQRKGTPNASRKA